jgi:hypothetical protein
LAVSELPEDELELTLEHRLVIKHGLQRLGDQIMLGGYGPITIGRSRSNRIVLLGPKVSRRHAMLTPLEDGWRVDDYQSTNGLIVNGEPCRSRTLEANDSLIVGNYELIYLTGPVTQSFEEAALNSEEGEDLVISTMAGEDDGQQTERMYHSGQGQLALSGNETAGQGQKASDYTAHHPDRGIEGMMTSELGNKANDGGSAGRPAPRPRNGSQADHQATGGSQNSDQHFHLDEDEISTGLAGSLGHDTLAGGTVAGQSFSPHAYDEPSSKSAHPSEELIHTAVEVQSTAPQAHEQSEHDPPTNGQSTKKRRGVFAMVKSYLGLG